MCILFGYSFFLFEPKADFLNTLGPIVFGLNQRANGNFKTFRGIDAVQL